MRRVPDAALAPFRALLDAYNQCFYDRDLAAFEALHAHDGGLVYFDNHAGCDTRSLADHLDRVGLFFRDGKATESGGVEPLDVDDLTVSADERVVVMTTTLRYRSAPRPGVRASFVLQRDAEDWRIRHVHLSFDPNEQGE